MPKRLKNVGWSYVIYYMYIYIYTHMWQAPKTSSDAVEVGWSYWNGLRFSGKKCELDHPHPFTTLLASRFNLIASFIGFIKHVQLLPDVLRYINVYNTILWIMCRGMKFSRFPQQKKTWHRRQWSARDLWTQFSWCAPPSLKRPPLISLGSIRWSNFTAHLSRQCVYVYIYIYIVLEYTMWYFMCIYIHNLLSNTIKLSNYQTIYLSIYLSIYLI